MGWISPLRRRRFALDCSVIEKKILVYRIGDVRNWPGTLNSITNRETEGKTELKCQFWKCTTQSKPN